MNFVLFDLQEDPYEWKNLADSAPHAEIKVRLLKAMHAMTPDHIHEELELMGPDFASYNFEWLTMSPRWRDHYYATDQTPHYEYMKTVLKILQWRHGPDRWVLKCPQHLEIIDFLEMAAEELEDDKLPERVSAIKKRLGLGDSG